MAVDCLPLYGGAQLAVARLVVLGIEVVGRWSEEARQFGRVVVATSCRAGLVCSVARAVAESWLELLRASVVRDFQHVGLALCGRLGGLWCVGLACDQVTTNSTSCGQKKRIWWGCQFDADFHSLRVESGGGSGTCEGDGVACPGCVVVLQRFRGDTLTFMEIFACWSPE